MFVNKATGEEILKLSPFARYGCGILYPQESISETVDTEHQDESSPVSSTEPASESDSNKTLHLSGEQTEGDSDSPDFDVSLTNARLPSSMAISFVLDTDSCEQMTVHISAATYKAFKVTVGSFTHDWWYRSPFSLEVDIPSASISTHHSSNIAVSSGRKIGEVPEELLNVRMMSRPISSTGQTLVTIAITNISKQHSPSSALFQTELSISALDSKSQGCILPYPESSGSENSDEELASYELLYRHDQTFAIGHGCAADWCSSPAEGKQRIARVFSQIIPTYETASITPDIIKQDGQPLSVSMEALSKLQGSKDNDGVIQLQELIHEYQTWITQKASTIPLLTNKQLQKTAERHLKDCRLCLQRMQTGLNLLTGVDDKSELAREAFRLANMAMFTQQRHTFREPRYPVVKAGKALFPEFQPNSKAGGQWRAFQIGFLLMSIASCVNREDPFREDVDLIWFPTGGGKTEAYLALTAFTMFYDRLARGEDCFGVQVLMRYTLRLLTTQQFTRAATLICAMENIRQQRNDLGDQPYSIGLWVGGPILPIHI